MARLSQRSSRLKAMKQKFLLALVIAAGIYIPSAFALAFSNTAFQQQVASDNADGYIFQLNSVSPPFTGGALANGSYGQNADGLYYWQPASVPVFYFAPPDGNSANVTFSVGLNSGGWKWWVFRGGNGAGSGNLYYTANGNNNYHVTATTFINHFTSATEDYYIDKIDGFDYSSVTNVAIDDDLYWTKVYALVYTQDDLSYINSASSLQQFLQILPQKATSTTVTFGPSFATTTSQGLAASQCDSNSSLISYGFCWAGVKLFYPSQASKDRIQELSQAMFGYFPMSMYADARLMEDELFNWNEASSTATTTQQLTIRGKAFPKVNWLPLQATASSTMGQGFETMKNIIGMIMLVVFGLVFSLWVFKLFAK